MNKLVDKARDLGFTEAVLLNDLEIKCESRLRAYCNPEGCPNHGNNWVCPPGSGSIEECAEKVSRFKSGILLQSVSELNPPVEISTYKQLNFKHNLRLKEFATAACGEYEDILVLTSGGCIFCDDCTYPEPCVKPDIRMNSLSAYGIDVGRLCGTAGLEYSFSPDKVYFVALVLVNTHVIPQDHI